MTPLEDLIRRMIVRDGPMPVSHFMQLALYHPKHGYYMHGTPIGRGGAFVTAPEISQVFGELLGLWCADYWQRIGGPGEVRLVELGPGRGTLMADALRAAGQAVPAFRHAVTVHLLETSPVLRAAQADMLDGHDPAWHEGLEEVPAGPTFLIANEFFDALPVQQFVRRDGHLTERAVAIDPETDELCFAAPAPGQTERTVVPLPEDGGGPDILQDCPAANGWAGAIGERLAGHGGAALIIDYGEHDDADPGNTLQAVRGHMKVSPLDRPGETDLTAHVDFNTLAHVAAQAGAECHGPVTQGAFLRRLGIEARQTALLRNASPDQAVLIETGCRRLIDPAEMGTLFRVVGLTAPGQPAPPGFEPEI